MKTYVLRVEMTSLLREQHSQTYRFSVQFDENQLHSLIKEELPQIPRELDQKMASSHVIVAHHLHNG